MEVKTSQLLIGSLDTTTSPDWLKRQIWDLLQRLEDYRSGGVVSDEEADIVDPATLVRRRSQRTLRDNAAVSE